MASISGFQVPGRHAPVLAALADIPEPEWAQILEAAEKDEATSLKAFTATLNDLLGGTDLSGESAIRVLISLQSVVATHQWDVDEVARLASASDDVGLAADKQQVLESRLKSLLRSEHLTTMAKSVDLVGEQPALFHSGRILSDLRPIFPEDPSARPSSFVVTHTFRFDYYDTDHARMRSFEMGISPSDLDDLVDMASRARAKQDALEGFLGDAGASIIDPEVS